MGLSKRILRGVLLLVSLTTTGVGAYLNILQITEYGIPSWAWYIIGYAFLLIFFAIIIFGYWKENRQYKKQLENLAHNDIRLERAKYRSAFIEKKNIVDKIVKLDRYIGKNISKQFISVSQFFKIVLRWYPWYEFPYLIFITITYITPLLKRIFIKMHYNFVIARAEKLNGILREFNKGTEIIMNTDSYRVLYDEIRDMGVGLPPTIIAKVNQIIKLSNVLHCMELLNLRKNSWKQVKYKRFLEPLYMIMRSQLNSITFKVDKAMSESLAEVSKDLEEYFLGKGNS